MNSEQDNKQAVTVEDAMRVLRADYRQGRLNELLARALDALDTSANDERARAYMDGCPMDMTAADARDLVEWLDQHDPQAAAAARAALGQ